MMVITITCWVHPLLATHTCELDINTGIIGMRRLMLKRPCQEEAELDLNPSMSWALFPVITHSLRRASGPEAG